MAAKDKREKQNFDKALFARETLIQNLNSCKSYDRLQEILKKIEHAKSKSQSPFKIGGLTAHHTATISAKDLDIAKLINLKKAEFPKPVVIAPVAEPIDVDGDKPEESTIDVPAAIIEPVLEDSFEPETSEDDASAYNFDEDMSEEKSLTNSNEHQLTDAIQSLNNFYMPEEHHEIKEFNHARAQELCTVRDKLDVLKVKMNELKKIEKGINNEDKAMCYRRAANAAMIVYSNINLLCSDYEHNKISLDVFKAKSKDILKTDNLAVIELNAHRGYKDVIANLLIAITGVGLLALAAVSLYNCRFTMFKVTETDSANKINALKDSVEHVQEAPVPK